MDPLEEGAPTLDTEPQAPITEHQALDITLRAPVTEHPAKGIMHPAKGITHLAKGTTLRTTTTTSSAAAILVEVVEAVAGACQVNSNV